MGRLRLEEAPGGRIRLDRAAFGRRERGRPALLVRVHGRAVRRPPLERRQARRLRAALVDERSHLGDVDGAPVAARPPGREPLHVTDLVHAADHAVDPAEAQRLVQRLLVDHAAAAGVPLVEPDPEFGARRVMGLEPAAERRRRLEERGCHRSILPEASRRGTITPIVERSLQRAGLVYNLLPEAVDANIHGLQPCGARPLDRYLRRIG